MGDDFLLRDSASGQCRVMAHVNQQAFYHGPWGSSVPPASHLKGIVKANRRQSECRRCIGGISPSTLQRRRSANKWHSDEGRYKEQGVSEHVLCNGMLKNKAVFATKLIGILDTQLLQARSRGASGVVKNCIKRHLKRLSQVQWCPDNAALSFMIPAQFVDRLQARVLLRAFCFLYTPICVPICLPLISPPLPFWPFLHCSAIRHIKVHPEEAGETSVLTNLRSENLRQRWFHKVLTPLENGKMRI